MLSTVMPYVGLVIAIASLGVSFLAMQFALTNKRSERDFRTLLLHITELEDLHEALKASHERLRSRVGMRELRARKKNGDDEPLSRDEEVSDIEAWKKQKRLELHTGKLKVR